MASTGRSKKWLITGASQGLGLAMAMSALKAGHHVLAGARNPSKAASDHPQVEAAGGKWLQLDVNSLDTQAVVSKAIEQSGGIDVVVNNAGYYLAGNIEDINEEEMQRAMSTNFFGPIRVLKGALPTLRAQRSGTIVLNSSILGIVPCPSGTMYCCPKAAGDMLMDILRIELRSFNIRSITLNVGAFKTEVFRNSTLPAAGFSQHYLEESAIGASGAMVGEALQDPDKHMPGDPVKFGDRVVDVVDGTGYGEALSKTQHVFMGKDALTLAELKVGSLKTDLDACQTIALSTDKEGSTSLGVAPIADM